MIVQTPTLEVPDDSIVQMQMTIVQVTNRDGQQECILGVLPAGYESPEAVTVEHSTVIGLLELAKLTYYRLHSQ